MNRKDKDCAGEKKENEGTRLNSKHNKPVYVYQVVNLWQEKIRTS